MQFLRKALQNFRAFIRTTVIDDDKFETPVCAITERTAAST